jgi:MFS family permease
VLAACAALVQPKAGRALDAGRLSANTGAAVGLVVTGLGLGCAMLPGLVGVLLAAVGIGVGTGLITPLAFASLASSTPEDRMGQTMGAAELGRELGDAGGPLLVAGAAAAATLTVGYAVLAGLTLAAPAVLTGNVRLRRSADHQPSTVTDDE